MSGQGAEQGGSQPGPGSAGQGQPQGEQQAYAREYQGHDIRQRRTAAGPAAIEIED